jgi:endonuclease/exonuclease/phosphatase family metal-dependent hydrolase
MKTRQPLNRISLLRITFVALAIAVPAAAEPLPLANDQRTVNVMTRNLYAGANFQPAINAVLSGDPAAVVAAVSEIWTKVGFTNFPARASGIAREIEQAQPDLIGLQEADLWRSQTPADLVMGNAEHVEYDFVQILLDALEARGLHYSVVAEERGVDVELPGYLTPANAVLGLVSDIRLTDREVILARTDLRVSELKLSNAQTGHYKTNLVVPISPTFTFVETRGWASVDAKVRGKDLRFITTHLEEVLPGPVDPSEQIREAQALELLAGPANTSLPVILVADGNSNANGDATTGAYSLLRAGGFADAWLEANPPKQQVSTCCADELLTSPTIPAASDDEGRIDLVLYRGSSDFGTLGIDLLGNNAATDKVSNGMTQIWPSDHAAVAATLEIRGGRPVTVISARPILP